MQANRISPAEYVSHYSLVITLYQGLLSLPQPQTHSILEASLQLVIAEGDDSHSHDMQQIDKLIQDGCLPLHCYHITRQKKKEKYVGSAFADHHSQGHKKVFLKPLLSLFRNTCTLLVFLSPVLLFLRASVLRITNTDCRSLLEEHKLVT